jgi:glycosyltransferase involved in cell wall biosynthesis
MSLSIAVVTSTRGRPLITQAIESVKAQTRGARHYVFAHGKDCWDAVSASTKGCDVDVVYLPAANGGGGYGMAPVFAASPFLVDEDVIFYLDDDNWYEPTHIEELVGMIEEHDLGWAYSLRRIVDADGNFICDDNCESLGMHLNSHNHYLVDNSCYAVRADIARQYSHAWYVPVVSDRAFMRALCQAKVDCGTTGKHSVNYRLSRDGTGGMTAEKFLGNNAYMHNKMPDFAWLQKSIFKY